MERYLRRLFILLCVAGPGLWGTCSAAHAQSLADALASAYTTNPQLQAGRAQLRATDEGVPVALSGWRPTATIDAEGGAGTEGDNHSDGLLGRAEFHLRQPIYTGGRVDGATHEAENLVQSQRAQLTSTEQQVLQQAITAYMDVLRDESILKLDTNHEKILETQLASVRRRVNAGELTQTDISQSQSRLANATAERIQAEANLSSSRAAYLEVMGAPPQALVMPEMPGNLPASEDEAVADSTSHPDIVAAQFSERAARNDVQSITGELRPTVSLDGVASTHNETAALLAEVSIPLYQGGGVAARVRQSKETLGARRLDTETQQRRAATGAAAAWYDLVAARARIVSFKTQAATAEQAVEGTRREEAQGQRTIHDVLDAEDESLDAQVNVVGAQHDAIVAAYRLLAAIGHLTAHDLGLPVQVYDPNPHYQAVREKWWGTDTVRP